MENFIEYLTQRIETCRDETAGLEKDGCRDDAGFEKVRMNIYDVCRTVTGALIDRPGAGKDAVQAQFERFRTEWSAALIKAREHGDVRNTVVGEIKLEALEDVIAHFTEAER